MKKLLITSLVFLLGATFCNAQEDVKKQAEEQMKMMQAPPAPGAPQEPADMKHPEPPIADPHAHQEPHPPGADKPAKELSEAERAEFEKAMVKLHEGRNKLHEARQIIHEKLAAGEITQEKFDKVLRDLEKTELEFDKSQEELVQKMHGGTAH